MGFGALGARGQSVHRSIKSSAVSAIAPLRLSKMTALEQLEWAVRALAQRFVTQMQLYPAFVVVSDELALEFEHGITLLSEADGASSLTTEQKDALDEL